MNRKGHPHLPGTLARVGLAAALALALAVPARAESASPLAAKVAELESAKQAAVAGKDGWMFLTAELRHLTVGRFWGADAAGAGRAPKAEWRDPLPAILDFRDQLKKAGIELLVVPVPPKAAIARSAVPGADALPQGRLDSADAEFYGVLAKQGVEVLDLEAELARAGAGTYCKTDSHWCGPGIDLAAAKIAERAKRGSWYAAAPKAKFAAATRDVEIRGDLARMLSPSPAPEKVSLRFVSREGDATGAPVAPDKASPVLLLGDSHTLVFHAGADMHATGAGLPDQLARELGFAVDLVGVRGSGATPARINLARRAGALEGKRLVVWCFGARELTEAAQGWAKVPVVR
jgi:alginate O-acetyltransferase complex protein AlgJ